MGPRPDTEGDVDMEDASPTNDAKASLDTANKSLAAHGETDAQTIITDFLDFTEYLPSDMVRSLTLIGKLDETYTEASIKVDDLTKTWGALPTLTGEARPSPTKLRAEISENLSQAVSSRVFAHAEAVRMSENVNRHYNKAKVLLEKLQALMENYPEAEEKAKSPTAVRSPQLSRSRPAAGAGPKAQRRRIPKITVPGEVLAPYDIEYDMFTDGDESSNGEESEAPATGRKTPGPPPRIKLLTSKIQKTPGRPPRNHEPMSPDAFSAAHAAHLAALKRPPPPDAVVGSADAPWLQLTDYELAKLRKRMKKNATWNPSDTMIARELKALGRGPDDYRLAKRKAEEEGTSFDPRVPSAAADGVPGSQQLPTGAISVDFEGQEGLPTSNRGMKLNEAKKLKREQLAKMAAEEAEESARKMAETAKLFLDPNGKTETPKDGAKKAKPVRGNKRKREEDERSSEVAEDTSAPGVSKRNKTETPVLPPRHVSITRASAARETTIAQPQLTPGGSTVPPVQTPVPLPIPYASNRGSATSPAPGSGASTVTTTVPAKTATQTPVPLPNRKASNTSLAPPNVGAGKRETRGDAAKRTRRSLSRATPPAGDSDPQSSPLSTPGPEPQPVAQPALRPRSRGTAASQEPPPSLASERPRRASTARITPAPERSPSRRVKRPAPGIVSTTNSGGNSAVGRRKAPPQKKTRAPKREKGQGVEVEIEVDDEGKPIDPNEPRYCMCNRVSFGTMIQCDNDVSKDPPAYPDNVKHDAAQEELECPATGTTNMLQEGLPGEQGVPSSGPTALQTFPFSQDTPSENEDESHLEQQLTKIQNCKQEWFHLECVGLSSIPARTTRWYCPDCRKVLGLGEKGEVNARGIRK